MILPNLLHKKCRRVIVPMPIMPPRPCCFHYSPRASGFYCLLFALARNANAKSDCSVKCWIILYMNASNVSVECQSLSTTQLRKALQVMGSAHRGQASPHLMGWHKLPWRTGYIIKNSLCVCMAELPSSLVGLAFCKHECVRPHVSGPYTAAWAQQTLLGGLLFFQNLISF